MNKAAYPKQLGPALTQALIHKGYTELTAVQTAVLDPAAAERDLRITSQTGSGKTIAIGFALRELVTPKPEGKNGMAAPRALVIAPTRELAKQVQMELGWLYKPLEVKVVSVTGGASYRDEHRALFSNPHVLVATPGRLLDHVEQGAVSLAHVSAVVLDEADRMLDMGFRDDLDRIFARTPKTRRTHLVSATFARDVLALADRVQRDAMHVQGTRLGKANQDIDHVVHLIEPRARLDAIINLLLASMDAQTLIFCRTRAEVSHISRELERYRFRTTSLSGEMQQMARNRALEGFKRGDVHVLVATDVAARGIDVQNISQVIHAEAPTSPDSYIHRSGRTGRAGRKGKSLVLVTVDTFRQAALVLQRAGVSFRVEPIPTAESIRRNQDEQLFEELTQEEESESQGSESRTFVLAQRLREAPNLTRTLARLLGRVRVQSPLEARDIQPIHPPVSGGKHPKAKNGSRTHHAKSSESYKSPRKGGQRSGKQRWRSR